MTTINAQITIENIDIQAIATVAGEHGLTAEFAQIRKTAKNLWKFVNRHNLGFLHSHTDEFLSHGRDHIFFKAYL